MRVVRKTSLRGRLGVAVVAIVIGGVSSANVSCSVVLGLDQLHRNDCLDGCDGGDAGIDDAGGDTTFVADAVTDRVVSDAAKKCTTDAQCKDSGTPHCRDGFCVACMPGADDDCPADSFCDTKNYTCAKGCKQTSDCPGAQDAGADGGTSPTLCCNHQCVDTSLDPAHCGACETACGAGNVCCASTCADLTSSANNCGACGTICALDHASGVRCEQSSCTFAGCGTGYADCDGKIETGCEVEISMNPAHCGACGACSTNHILGTPSCSASTCSGTCEAGFADCNNAKLFDGCEANLATDILHCGSCPNACSLNNIATASCTQGVCDGTCKAGFADCDTNKLFNGCETRIDNDPLRCGGCSSPCSGNNIPTKACVSGSCTGTCSTDFDDCNNNKLTDGCESNLAIDAAHCGGCANACSNNNIPSPTCSARACTGVCSAGFLDCNVDKLTDGCETNSRTDRNNCGFCGNVCPGTQTCVAGSCGVTYTQAASPQAFVDACSITPHSTFFANNIDDDAGPLTALPFAFTFYGVNVLSAWVGTNGSMGFDTPNPTFTFGCLPNIGDPRPAILPFGDDLITRSGGICTATIGTTPNQKFVATWSDVRPVADISAHLTFSVFLSETSNLVDVVYQTMTGGAQAQGSKAVVGIQDGAGARAAQFICKLPVSVSSGTAVRFTPQ